MPPLSALDLQEARGLPRTIFHRGPESCTETLERQNQMGTLLQTSLRGLLDINTTDNQRPFIFTSHKHASKSAKNHSSSLTTLSVKHRARGLPVQIAAIDTHTANLAEMPMPTTDRYGNTRDNTNKAFSMKGPIDISPTSSVFTCDLQEPHLIRRRSSQF